MYRAGGSLVLCFDYDGTLAPFADLPHLAKLPARTRSLLGAFSKEPGIFVGIVSAREMEDLKSMVGLSNLLYCGTAGMEFDLQGIHVTHPESEKLSKLMEDLSDALEAGIQKHAGAWLEKKKLGLTVHYRAVAREDVDPLIRTSRQILHGHQSELRILDGAMALEVTPACGWTKGSAVRKIFDHVAGKAAQAGILYAGDEANDEDGFDAANALGGISIGVGPRAPANARHRLAETQDLADILTGFLVKIDPSTSSRLKDEKFSK